MTTTVTNPYELFTDIDGTPLEAGYIYIGEPNLDPITNPVAVYWDFDLTIPASQPIRTIDGYPSYSGTPGTLYTADDYSIIIKTKRGTRVLSSPSGVVVGDATALTYSQGSTQAIETSVASKLQETVSVKDFGAKGDGVTDDTLAITNAFIYANSLKRNGIGATIKHPGCTVLFPAGTYSLSSIASTISIECNTRNYGAKLLIPQAYAGTVLTVGLTTPTIALHTASIELPEISRPSFAPIQAGSIGVRVVNINNSNIYCGNIYTFEIGLGMGGIGEGTVYNNIYLQTIGYCDKLINIVPGAGGWFNTNNIFKGNLRQGDGNRNAGKYHLYIDGSSPATKVIGNSFYGLSLEGNGSQYVVYAKNAYLNNFVGCYHESGSPLLNVAVSGDTLTTASAHGLVVGDMLNMVATVLPTGMFDATNYYVAVVTDTLNFKISLNRDTTPITFTSTGTAVKYILQPRCYFDGTGGAQTYGNQFRDLFSPASNTLDFFNSTTLLSGNSIRTPYTQSIKGYSDADIPAYRASNFSANATTKVVYAAYPATVDPDSSPTSWTTGLADQGVMFKSLTYGRLGRITASIGNSTGTLLYESGATGATREIAGCFRTSTLQSFPGGNIPANTRSLYYYTVTGVGATGTTGQYVTIGWAAALPVGLTFVSARVSSANTVEIAIHNLTGAAVNIGTGTFNIMVHERFI